MIYTDIGVIKRGRIPGIGISKDHLVTKLFTSEATL